MKDFTLEKYEQLLDALPPVYPVRDYFELKGVRNVLRHDVDRRPENALRMALLEDEYLIYSTYYFRASTFDEAIIRKISNLGHEIGYHYEVMDKAHGDIGRAHAILNKELSTLRKLAPVYTCAAHGNPLTRWNNRDFWDYFDPYQFGLMGDAYAVPGNYFTDTGRNWQGKSNIKDFSKATHHYTAKDTDELIRFIPSLDSLYLSIHPERWNDGLAWYRQWLWDSGCNQAKKVIKKVRR